MDFKNKVEKQKYYKDQFYKKWGNYNSFLKANPVKKRIKVKSSKLIRDFIYLKVHKTKKGDELWISPAGTKKEFFLTTGKITMKKIKNWRMPVGNLL